MHDEHPASTPALRIRLDIAYDGTGFSGWAKQPGLRTVQGTIEDAIAVLFRREGDPPRLTVAGRTDVGVHAVGQVAHLDLNAAQVRGLRARARGPLPGDGSLHVVVPHLLARRVNGILGQYSDVVIQRAAVAADGFDARFSALWRRYEYRIADEVATRDPLRRHSTTWLPMRLDEAAMDEAARSLLGLHDFASFCKPREGATTIRTLLDFSWRRDEDAVLVATVRADAFCHSMVRALVGACASAGEERPQPLDVAGLRDAAERSNEFKVMPARGLTLVEVGYPDDSALAERAALTRARRASPDPLIREAQAREDEKSLQ